MKLYTNIISEIRKSQKITGSRPIEKEEPGHNIAVRYIKSNNLDLDNHGITMTKIPKVGINPRSEYKTPIGIYFYPMQYYVYKITSNNQLPWQHNANYINILEFADDSNILNLKEMSEETARYYLNALFSLKEMEKYVEFRSKEMLLITKDKTLTKDQVITSIIDRAWNNSKWNATINHHPGGRFWYVLYTLSKSLSENSEKLLGTNSKPAVIWNWLLRKMGFDIVIDLGLGIIHGNEPTQGFALTKKSIRWIKTIDNPEFSKYKIDVNKYISVIFDKQSTDSELIDAIYELTPQLSNPYGILFKNSGKLINSILNRINNSSTEVRKAFLKKARWSVLKIKLSFPTIMSIAEKYAKAELKKIESVTGKILPKEALLFSFILENNIYASKLREIVPEYKTLNPKFIEMLEKDYLQE